MTQTRHAGTPLIAAFACYGKNAFKHVEGEHVREGWRLQYVGKGTAAKRAPRRADMLKRFDQFARNRRT